MNIRQTNNPSKTSKIKVWIISGIIAGITIVVGIGAYFFSHNYAQDAAQPLESALLHEGATKVCSLGDAGRGPDNFAPNYQAEYEFSGTKEEAVKLVTKAARDNGYTLTYQQSPYSYIAWYSDNVGKKSTYPGFSNGNVKISFSLYNAGSNKLYCGKQPLRADATHTAISLGAGLPSSN